jgi:hypothetical protein
MSSQQYALAVAIGLIAAVTGCSDKAEPKYTECVALEGESVPKAKEACEEAVRADPLSTKGRAAAEKLAQLWQGPASSSAQAPSSATAATTTSAAPETSPTTTTTETPASPFPPDPGCPEGRGVLGSQYGPVRYREKTAPCGTGDVCGFFYLAASSLTCQDGGDTAAEQAKKMLADSGVSQGTVIVLIDVNGRRAAGIVFPTAEIKQSFLTALGKPEDKLFTSYAVWRAFRGQNERQGKWSIF